MRCRDLSHTGQSASRTIGWSSARMAGKTIGTDPVPLCGCSIREGTGSKPGTRCSCFSGLRHNTRGWKADTWCFSITQWAWSALEGLLEKPERPRVEWNETDCQWWPRRSWSSQKSCVWQHPMAEMPVSSATHRPDVLRENAGAYLPKQSMRLEVAADIRAMFNACDRKAAEELLQTAIQKYADTAPRLSAWLEDNLAEGFTVFDFPLEHRRTIRTTNSLERINKEIRRRTRVAGVFPNEASCLRLISAMLMEMSEEWQIGKRYCAGKSLDC